MQPANIAEAAELLLGLRRRRATIDALPDHLIPSSVEEGYKIQDALHTADGSPVVLKVGCTSKQAQDALGIPHPIAGRIGADMAFSSNEDLPRSAFGGPPLVECEIALQVDAVGQVIAVAPALELVDTRFDGAFAPGTPSLIADNSGSGGVVIGSALALEGLDIAALAVCLCVDGAEVASGTGDAVMGGPAESVRWVLEHEQSRGRSVPGDTWIITGTCTGLTPTTFGTTLTADFGALGTVSTTLLN